MNKIVATAVVLLFAIGVPSAQADLGKGEKAFKRGAGGLYKAKRIKIHGGGIALVEPEEPSES